MGISNHLRVVLVVFLQVLFVVVKRPQVAAVSLH